MRVASCILFVLAALTMAAGQDTNFSTGPQYLVTYGSPLFLHSIATPSMAWPSPPANVGASDATSRLSAGADNNTADTLPQPPPQANLFLTYYGAPPVQQIVLQGYSGEAPSEERLPASILDVGTWQIADQSVMESASWKLPLTGRRTRATRPASMGMGTSIACAATEPFAHCAYRESSLFSRSRRRP